jgi:hypothetical protein
MKWPFKQKTVLITTEEVELRIREVFQETLLGPVNLDSVQADFHPSFPCEERYDCSCSIIINCCHLPPSFNLIAFVDHRCRCDFS